MRKATIKLIADMKGIISVLAKRTESQFNWYITENFEIINWLDSFEGIEPEINEEIVEKMNEIQSSKGILIFLTLLHEKLKLNLTYLKDSTEKDIDKNLICLFYKKLEHHKKLEHFVE